ncbi:MAG TPA: hypothetical protein VG899_03410 [Mycobacteriales bacterium]|nr:hypothetical protein [Mycobacteriales bacterium]HWA65401.1 hypothetical protein [Mycobacteriales bacterium]
MTSAASAAVVGQPEKLRRPKVNRDLWLCWWVMPFFYLIFGIVFVPLTRVMPPQSPTKSTAGVVHFFAAHRTGIQIGFVLLLIFISGAGICGGLVAYQMKRMSVNPVLAYSYIATLAVGGIPGCLLGAFSFLVGAFRPDRDPQLLHLLYDTTFLTFVGSLGCFATNYLVLSIAILLDKNGIYPRWLAYVGIWQIVTEVIAIPCFIYRTGPFAWNGALAFYEGTLIFGVFLVALIYTTRQAIETQPAGETIQA